MTSTVLTVKNVGSSRHSKIETTTFSSIPCTNDDKNINSSAAKNTTNQPIHSFQAPPISVSERMMKSIRRLRTVNHSQSDDRDQASNLSLPETSDFDDCHSGIIVNIVNNYQRESTNEENSTMMRIDRLGRRRPCPTLFDLPPVLITSLAHRYLSLRDWVSLGQVCRRSMALMDDVWAERRQLITLESDMTSLSSSLSTFMSQDNLWPQRLYKSDSALSINSLISNYKQMYYLLYRSRNARELRLLQPTAQRTIIVGQKRSCCNNASNNNNEPLKDHPKKQQQRIIASQSSSSLLSTNNNSNDNNSKKPSTSIREEPVSSTNPPNYGYYGYYNEDDRRQCGRSLFRIFTHVHFENLTRLDLSNASFTLHNLEETQSSFPNLVHLTAKHALIFISRRHTLTHENTYILRRILVGYNKLRLRLNQGIKVFLVCLYTTFHSLQFVSVGGTEFQSTGCIIYSYGKEELTAEYKFGQNQHSLLHSFAYFCGM